MEGLEKTSFEIISTVGMARSCFIEAIREARHGDFSSAKSLLTEGNKYFNEGHLAHTKLVQAEASGERFDMNILLTHAQDQMMSAESFKILCEEFIETYKILHNNCIK